jgi:hypothetical protein
MDSKTDDKPGGSSLNISRQHPSGCISPRDEFDMVSKAIATLQFEIEAKQREVQRLAEIETKKNAIPPLIEAIEEHLSVREGANEPWSSIKVAKDACEDASRVALTTYNVAKINTDNYLKIPSLSIPLIDRLEASRKQAKFWLEQSETYTENKRREMGSDSTFERSKENTRNALIASDAQVVHLEAQIAFEEVSSSIARAATLATNTEYIMLKSLLNNAREDMDWKQANSDMVGVLNLNVSNLQSRLDTIDAEKLNEHRKVKMWKFRMICAFLGAATAWIVHYCLEYPRNDSTVLTMT